MTITFRTTDVDTAAAVYDQTADMPQAAQIGGGVVEFRFGVPEAPEAARKFRNDNRLQSFITAKKTIFRLLQRQSRIGGV